MTQADRAVLSPEVMSKYVIGSVLRGGGSVPTPFSTSQQWIDMVNAFQKGSLSSRLGIPMNNGIDVVHVHNNIYKATLFPHNVGLGATGDSQLVIQYVFAPCITVCRDPRWGHCYESYSEDPEIVEEMIEIFSGLQGEILQGGQLGAPYVVGQKMVAACVKHFHGDGDTQKGINEYITIIDFHSLLSIHMPPYYDASYDAWQGVDRITYPPQTNYSISVSAAIQAGIDMVMVGHNFTGFIDDLTNLMRSGVISMGTLLVNDRMLESYVIARDRFLVPIGKMFPTIGGIHLSSFSDEFLNVEIANKSLFWQQHNYYGLILPLYMDLLFKDIFLSL
ncbi:uncharacterized protein [Aristolochia californica]|uniref:uncharacterized protein n=1 Tax=Aristolochia californica TaxID=171875 RepID=UPI0035E2791F